MDIGKKWKQGERSDGRAMGEDSNGFTEVTCLTVYALGVFEHSNDETEFAKQTMFPGAIQSDV